MLETHHVKCIGKPWFFHMLVYPWVTIILDLIWPNHLIKPTPTRRGPFEAAITFPTTAFCLLGTFAPDNGQFLARTTIGNLGLYVVARHPRPIFFGWFIMIHQACTGCRRCLGRDGICESGQLGHESNKCFPNWARSARFALIRD